MSYHARSVHWLLWPVWALWRFVALIVEMTGRLIAVLLGFVLIVVGALLCMTLIGAIVGIPLMVTGTMLVIRGIL
jgi:hypothetical protein